MTETKSGLSKAWILEKICVLRMSRQEFFSHPQKIVFEKRNTPFIYYVQVELTSQQYFFSILSFQMLLMYT